MLKLGEKGAIPQKQENSYTIAPHIPCGFVTPELLRKIASKSLEPHVLRLWASKKKISIRYGVNLDWKKALL